MLFTAVWIILGTAALLYLGSILVGMLAAAPGSDAVERYFSEPFLARAAAYQKAVLTVFLLQQVLYLVFLVAVAYTALCYFQAAPRLSLPAAAGYILLFLIAAQLINLPFDFYRGSIIERRFGLSAQAVAGWFTDYGKSALISLLLSAVALTGLYVLITWRPAHWWFFAGTAFALFLILGSYLYPLLIDPLFYRFTELEDRQLQEEIMKISSKAGLEVERILVADASRRTHKANAYFSGIGGTKRIVIYDNLLERFTPEEVLAVIAHEMGHWRYGHLWRGLLISAAGSFVAFYALQLILQKVGLHADFRALPLILLFFALLSLAAVPAQNALSRCREQEADRYAFALIGDPAPFVSLYQKLARTNLSVVQPHPLLKAALYTHPPLMERIEAAQQEAVEKGEDGKRE
jgi:STE24 endopeptidase